MAGCIPPPPPPPPKYVLNPVHANLLFILTCNNIISQSCTSVSISLVFLLIPLIVLARLPASLLFFLETPLIYLVLHLR